MGLFSFFQRGQQPGAVVKGPPADGSSVEAMRSRARRRLLGAAVLVVAAVVGFPLLFETQPRPIRSDVALEVVKRNVAAATVAPPIRPLDPPLAPERVTPNTDALVERRSEPANAASAAVASPVYAASTAAVPDAPPVESKTGPIVAPAVPASGAAASTVATPSVREAPRAPAPDERTPDATQKVANPAPTAPAPQGNAPDKVSPAPSGSRFVVQVGAFAEAAAVREARGRMEKLGLRTYTQDVATSSGKRTRVRVGPFSERDEAERAAAKIKAAGLVAAVLTL